MRKISKIVVFSLLLTLCFSVTITAEVSSAENIVVFADGKEVICDVPPVIENGRTLVPVRAISESIGFEVGWDETTGKITLKGEDNTILIYLGRTAAYKNGKQLSLDVPAKIKDDRTLVPLRFVGECFGYKVDWDEKGRRVLLTSEGKKGVLSVEFLDVGQGDSIFIIFPDGKNMLIDAGNKENGAEIIEHIEDEGYDTINFLVATHPHADHIGGMTQVIKAFEIEKYFMPKTSHNTKTYETMLETIKSKKGKITEAKTGVEIYSSTYNGMKISARILAPKREKYKDVNNYSAVIMLTYGNTKYLFMGDAETFSEEEIEGNIKADVLKVGHHGSKSSTSEKFLRRVNPGIAVISVGKDNSYGHPKQEIIDRITKHGCKLYRTDLDGNIEICSDGIEILDIAA